MRTHGLGLQDVIVESRGCSDLPGLWLSQDPRESPWGVLRCRLTNVISINSCVVYLYRYTISAEGSHQR